MELDRPWASEGGCVVLPARGHLTLGHLLVCSRSHVPNLISTSPALRDAVVESVGHVERVLSEEFGSPVFAFEHGFVGGTGVELGCSIDHLHIHVLPLRQGVVEKVVGWLDDFCPWNSARDIDPSRYLLARSPSSGQWKVSPRAYRPVHRHFLKKLDEVMDRTARYDETVVDSSDLIRATYDRIGLLFEPVKERECRNENAASR